MPAIRHVLESALYVDDLDRAVGFYRDVLGLEIESRGPRLTAMKAGGATLLLLFLRGGTTQGVTFYGGRIPPHDGAGPIHVGLAIEGGELEAWERRLAEHGVEVESRVSWERGGKSLYFRDPDGHSLELVTPGTWTVY